MKHTNSLEIQQIHTIKNLVTLMLRMLQQYAVTLSEIAVLSAYHYVLFVSLCRFGIFPPVF